MLTEITKAQLLCLQLGRMKDSGVMEPIHVSMAKMNNVAMALECARTARGILGANGITADYPIMRHIATSSRSTRTRARTKSIRWRLENTLPALTPSTCNEKPLAAPRRLIKCVLF